MANNTIVPLTARKIGPSDVALSRAKVFYLPEEDIQKLEIHKARKACVIFSKNIRSKKLEVYESVLDVKTAQAEGASTNPYIGNNADLAVTAAGSVLTAGTALSKYLNKVTAATATTGAALKLPPPSDRNVCVIINGTSVPLSVFPNGASASIDGAASGVVKALGAFRRMHFYCEPTTGNGASAAWKTAIDTLNP